MGAGHERFNGILKQELIYKELFYSLREARAALANWQFEYNHIRPHGSLGYKPPAPLVHIPKATVGNFKKSASKVAQKEGA